MRMIVSRIVIIIIFKEALCVKFPYWAFDSTFRGLLLLFYPFLQRRPSKALEVTQKTEGPDVN